MFFIVFIAALIILLQCFLSMRRHGAMGLILPIISFILALLAFHFAVEYSRSYYLAGTRGTGNLQPSLGMLEMLVGTAKCNIPTVILLVIYFICGKIVKKKENISNNPIK